MENNMLKINILSIAITGLLMFLSGGILYIFKDFFASHIRYVLPIPPLSVAAYVFVFNMFKHYNGNIPDKKGDVFLEILYATLTSTIVFFIFTWLLIIFIQFIKKP